jgi:DNA mismatch repair protein MutL
LHYTKMGKIIGQAFNSYIIIEASEWLQILDQHALAERIIYERLIKKWYTPKIQWLLISESFELSASEYALVEENIDTLREFGFECEALGSDILQISGIPDFIQKTNLKDVIEWVISDLADSRIGKSKT